MAGRPRIAIRADASARIGTGHVRRMRSLASGLRSRGAEVRFFTRALGFDMGGTTGDHATVALGAPVAGYAPPPGSPPHAPWAEVDQMADAGEFTEAAAGYAPDWVVVDHYAFDARWHDAVRGALRCRVMVVDDIADRPLAPDLLVDHNLHDDHRLKYHGLIAGDCVLLAGPRHALLDPAFAAADRHEVRAAADRVGLFFGGADPDDVTSTVFAALRRSGFEGDIGLVTSSNNPHVERLRERVAGDARATLAVDLPDLTVFFAGYDIQVGAGGGATWERLCIGAPSVLVALADNQHDVLAPLACRGVAVVMPPAWTVDDVCRAVRSLAADREARRGMGARARAMVDGRGVARVADAMVGSVGLMP